MEPTVVMPVILIGASVAGLILILVVAALREPATSDAGESAHGRHPASGESAEASEKSREQLRERLVHAGLYRANSPSFYYAMQVMFAAVPIVIGISAYNLGMIRYNVAMLLGVIFGIAGVIAPGLWLDFRKSRRQTTIRRSIPDALDVITICVEAGLSLSASIVRVSRDLAATHPLLATELTIVHRHIQMGKTSGEALRSFAERFDLTELRSLASVVMQSERFGASIASALRAHGDSLRKKRMQKAHERAQKAAIWILLPTVFCIFPAIFVVILGPAAYDISDLLNSMKQ
jgi:tight adherence protein C